MRPFKIKSRMISRPQSCCSTVRVYGFPLVVCSSNQFRNFTNCSPISNLRGIRYTVRQHQTSRSRDEKTSLLRFYQRSKVSEWSEVIAISAVCLSVCLLVCMFSTW